MSAEKAVEITNGFETGISSGRFKEFFYGKCRILFSRKWKDETEEKIPAVPFALRKTVDLKIDRWMNEGILKQISHLK